MNEKYLVTYFHNKTEDTEKIKYEDSVAWKFFDSKQKAVDWIKNNPQITPILLLRKNAKFDVFEKIKKFDAYARFGEC